MSFSVSLPPVFPPQLRFCTQCPPCLPPLFFQLSHLHCFALFLPRCTFRALSVTEIRPCAVTFHMTLFEANCSLIICFSVICLYFSKKKKKKFFFLLSFSGLLSPVTQACPLGAEANHCSGTGALVESVLRRRLRERGHNGLPLTPSSAASFSSPHIRIVHRVPLLSR